MRAIVVGCCVVVAVLLLALGLPRLASSIARAPGDQAIGLANAGYDIRPESYQRAVQSLERALSYLDHRRAYFDLLVVHQNNGRQIENVNERWGPYGAAIDALHRSMGFSPVEPMGWLLTAQMHYERGENEAAAFALAWSLRTGRYLRHQVLSRAFLGLGLWELLDEASRVRLMDSIVETFRQGPDVFAGWAVELDLDEDIVTRLRSREPDGQYLAEQFMQAMDSYFEAREAAILAAQEGPPMRRVLAATSLLVTVSLPVFTQAMSIEEYLAVTRGEGTSREAESIDDYLTGVLDGLVMLDALSEQNGAALFCMPPQDAINIDVQEFRRAFDDMLAQFERQVPDFARLAQTRSVGLAALQLLTMQHPCDG